MKRWEKWLFFTCAVVGLAGFGRTDAFARTQIASVSLKVEAEIVPETDYGDEEIEVTVRSDNYEFASYEVINDDNVWKLNMVPKIEVVLTAVGDYYFPSQLTASKIKIIGGTYVSAKRAESDTELIITIHLPSLTTYIGEMEEVTLGQDGVASWQPVIGAGEYLVRLYRGSSGVGPMVSTANTSYDFSPLMLRANGYRARVRAVNATKPENKSDPLDSNEIHVSETEAAANKEANTGMVGEWRADQTGRWYCHGDGSYTTSGWEKIHGTWFMFDGAGYMRTGWVEADGKTYYFNPENGAMVTDATVDGRALGADGAAQGLN